MAEEYLLTRNRTLTEFTTPIVSVLSPTTHALVNELGFRLYVALLNEKGRGRVDELPDDVVAASVRDTVKFIRALREREPGGTASMQEIGEAKHIANNLTLFFRRFSKNEIIKVSTGRMVGRETAAFPVFRGCGWLDECAGDLLMSNTLFEVKAGNRKFRSIDLRQVLSYSALNFSAKTYEIVDICLVNPRLGVFLGESLQRLCLELSGRTAPEVLGEIVEYVSAPIDRYIAG